MWKQLTARSAPGVSSPGLEALASVPDRPARGPLAALCAWPRSALVALLGFLYLPWIGALPLNGTLEGNRLEAAREMLRSGDALVPTLGGEVYLAKPPLHPWTLALVGAASGGLTRTAGRFVSVLAALGTCLLVLAFARRELSRRAGVFAALALGASVLMVEKAVRAELETELTFFTTWALCLAWQATRTASVRGRWISTAVAGLALGAALLVKGPPALVIFLAAAVPLVCIGAERRTSAAVLASVLGLALVCAGAWVGPVVARLGFERTWSAFHVQFVERIVQAGRTNEEPVWFYLPALLIALLPAALWLPMLATVWPTRVGAGRSRLALFLWGWGGLSLLVLSVSSGKETRYLLPTLPAWALLLGWGAARARARNRLEGLRRGTRRAAHVGLLLAPVLWLAIGGLAFPEARATVGLSAGLGALALFFLRLRARSRPILTLAALVLAVASAKFAWAGTILARQARAIPIDEVARAVREELAPGESFGLLGPYRSWWEFSVERPCVSIPDAKQLDSAPVRVLLGSESHLPSGSATLEPLGRWIVEGEPYVLWRRRT